MSNADWWKVAGIAAGAALLGVLFGEYLGSRGHLTFLWPSEATRTTTSAPGLSESGS